MLKSDISKSKRIASGVIAALMLFVLLFSASYIAAEADHDCTGHDCPICACIQQCENTLQQIGSGVATQVAVALPILFTFLLGAVWTFCVQMETPVTRKVRLNN